MKPSHCGELYGGRLGELEEGIDFLMKMPADGEQSFPSKILVSVGVESIGTERFLNTLGHMMANFISPHRFLVFRGKARASKSTIMFVLWKKILGDVLTSVGKTILSNKSVSNANGKLLKFIALDFVLARLPPAVKELAPLLSHFGLIPKSAEFTMSTKIAQMSDPLKLTKVIEFIATALEVVIDFLRKLPTPTSALVFSM